MGWSPEPSQVCSVLLTLLPRPPSPCPPLQAPGAVPAIFSMPLYLLCSVCSTLPSLSLINSYFRILPSDPLRVSCVFYSLRESVTLFWYVYLLKLTLTTCLFMIYFIISGTPSTGLGTEMAKAGSGLWGAFQSVSYGEVPVAAVSGSMTNTELHSRAGELPSPHPSGIKSCGSFIRWNYLIILFAVLVKVNASFPSICLLAILLSLEENDKVLLYETN